MELHHNNQVTHCFKGIKKRDQFHDQEKKRSILVSTINLIMPSKDVINLSILFVEILCVN